MQRSLCDTAPFAVFCLDVRCMTPFQSVKKGLSKVLSHLLTSQEKSQEYHLKSSVRSLFVLNNDKFRNHYTCLLKNHEGST